VTFALGVFSRRRIVSLGSIYTSLDRLGKKGFVTPRFADASAERDGRPRKYFRIEVAGQAALQHSLRQVPKPKIEAFCLKKFTHGAAP
jgi:DNA-binding PadR family transcriptional regulator